MQVITITSPRQLKYEPWGQFKTVSLKFNENNKNLINYHKDGCMSLLLFYSSLQKHLTDTKNKCTQQMQTYLFSSKLFLYQYSYSWLWTRSEEYEIQELVLVIMAVWPTRTRGFVRVTCTRDFVLQVYRRCMVAWARSSRLRKRLTYLHTLVWPV